MQDINAFYRLRKQIMEREFSRMNKQQQEAVFHTEGALLILAGAGSGKTTVLVNRIANMIKYGRAYTSREMPASLSEEDWHLLQDCAAGIRPVTAEAAALCAVDPCPAWRILAITFTNKAAGELKERLTNMLGSEGGEVMASTFHAFCARILRRECEYLGYTSHFTIYDTDDSRRLMKECMKLANVEEKTLSHKAILGKIGRAKDCLLTPEEYAQQVGSDFRRKKVADCYRLYQKRLKDADAMDFDDLLCRTVDLFVQNPDVLERYQKRYRYLMVDEYQDTNHAQYKLISLLAARSGNLCVVGDDDQSIYKFRGATIENILNFEDEFQDCKVIRLEQNYRSTQNILNAANAVIAKNQNRKGKTLWTQNPEGDKLKVHTLDNEDEEGRFIADTILEGVGNGRKYSDFAILYRANAQSNAVERALVKSGVPYRVIGGHRFYDTKEVRDAMAYLRVIQNPEDSISLRRIINEPKRGIGDTTMDNAAEIAENLGVSLYEVIAHAGDYPSISRASAKLKSFTDMLDHLREMNDDPENSVHLLYATMLENTGYLAMWQAAGETEAARVDNLNELASSIKDYEKNSDSDFPDLAGFLEEAALMTDVDNYDASADSVVMMTMHAAKGLEFPVVFLPGFEDGLFPGMQTIYQPDEMEEERRLCYVAITRAKEELYLLHANSRMIYGSTTRNRVSRFLQDIPEDLMECTQQRHESAGTAYSYARGSAEWQPKPAFSGAASHGRSEHPAAGSVEKPKSFTRPVSISNGTTAVSWQKGDRIVHKVFGAGVITAVTPMGNDQLLEIHFEKVGVKKIMANFAKLTKV